MDSETNFEINPVNQNCKNVVNNQVIQSDPNTNNNNASSNVNTTLDQHTLDSQYDNTDAIIVKPMYGGNKKFKIIFKKKEYLVISNNEINAIKNVLNNKIYKTDNLLEIKCNNNKHSMYIIKGNYKNKIKKIH